MVCNTQYGNMDRLIDSCNHTRVSLGVIPSARFSIKLNLHRTDIIN